MRNLQPWIDFQKMLEEYARCGCLYIPTESNEAYITRAAFFTLCPTVTEQQHGFRSYIKWARRLRKEVRKAAYFIRLYRQILDAYHEGHKLFEMSRMYISGGTSDAGTAQTTEALQRTGKKGRSVFALHIVDDEYPHTPLFALLISLRRRWFWPWRKMEHYNIIRYGR